MFTDITVTGAPGFVGKHLVKRIIAEGFNDTRVISRSGKAEGYHGGAKAVKIITADLAQVFPVSKP